MEYFFIIVLNVIGITLHALKQVMELDKKFPNDTLSEVFGVFWKSDRITLIISGVLMILHITVHAMVEFSWPSVRDTVFTIPFIDVKVPYAPASFITAFAIGFFGQMMFYRFMGKAEAYLNKKAEDKSKI